MLQRHLMDVQREVARLAFHKTPSSSLQDVRKVLQKNAASSSETGSTRGADIRRAHLQRLLPPNSSETSASPSSRDSLHFHFSAEERSANKSLSLQESPCADAPKALSASEREATEAAASREAALLAKALLTQSEGKLREAQEVSRAFCHSLLSEAAETLSCSKGNERRLARSLVRLAVSRAEQRLPRPAVSAAPPQRPQASSSLLPALTPVADEKGNASPSATTGPSLSAMRQGASRRRTQTVRFSLSAVGEEARASGLSASQTLKRQSCLLRSGAPVVGSSVFSECKFNFENSSRPTERSGAALGEGREQEQLQPVQEEEEEVKDVYEDHLQRRASMRRASLAADVAANAWRESFNKRGGDGSARKASLMPETGMAETPPQAVSERRRSTAVFGGGASGGRLSRMSVLDSVKLCGSEAEALSLRVAQSAEGRHSQRGAARSFFHRQEKLFPCVLQPTRCSV